MNKTNFFSGEFSDFHTENNVMYLKVKDEITVFDLNAAKQVLVDRLEYAQGKDALMIFDCNNVQSYNMDAQKFDSSEEGLQGVIAMAVIIKSTFQRVLGNVFFAFQKPKVPIKMFTDVESCHKWLERFK